MPDQSPSFDPLDEALADAAPAWLPPAPADPQHRPLFFVLLQAHAAGERVVTADVVGARVGCGASRAADRLGQGEWSGWCVRDGSGWRLRRADDLPPTTRADMPRPRPWDPPPGTPPTREALDRAAVAFFDSLADPR